MDKYTQSHIERERDRDTHTQRERDREREREREMAGEEHTEKADFMAAMRSLCGPLELAIAYDGRLELFVDVLCHSNSNNNRFKHHKCHSYSNTRSWAGTTFTHSLTHSLTNSVSQ